MKTVHQLSMLLALALAVVGCTGAGETGPEATARGAPQTVTTRVLETGARLLQPDAPTDALDVYLVGFHPMKDEPTRQMEAHHFCNQVNRDFMQCALYDGNTPAANLTGIEYIISERLFETLPEREKAFWHPHNFEILSGQLVAPGLPEPADRELMRSKMNSYGKTWHTWDTGHGSADASLPLGPPRLAWSFNRLGEARAGLVEDRDRRMGIDTGEQRRARSDLVGEAHPQAGVDALRWQFPGPTRPIPGVVDRDAAR